MAIFRRVKILTKFSQSMNSGGSGRAGANSLASSGPKVVLSSLPSAGTNGCVSSASTGSGC